MRKNFLMYIAMLSFVAISSFVFVTPVNTRSSAIPNKVLSYSTPQIFPELPVLKSGMPFPVVSAQAVFAMDVDSGVVLYEKAPKAPFLPASTTKILTALVAMDYFSFDQVLTVGNPAIDGQKMHLRTGEKITFESLLNGLLVFSANDAALVLAQNYPGGQSAFVVKMNEKAEQLGLMDSNFSNPAGLDDFSQVTNARDMTLVGIYAMQDERLATIVGKKTEEVKSVDGKIVHALKNTNELLAVEGYKGVKTGWTENARENLISFYEKDGKKIAVTLLGSQDRFGETQEIVNWILANYIWEPVIVATR